MRVRRGGLMLGALLASVLASLGTLSTTSFADTVPLPKRAPQAKESAAPQAAQKPAAAPQSPAEALTSTFRSLFHLDKDPEPPAATTNPGSLTQSQRAQVDRVSVQNLVGNFVQVGPDGSRVKGELYLQKPGRVRFEYDPPSPIQIVADGQSVIVRDRRLGTQDSYPLSQTPLRFLLSERIDLLRDTNVVGVRADDVYVTVIIEERQALVGTSRLMMMLGAKDYQLKQWTVTDPQGYDTTVAISNLDTSKRPDPAMFRVDYTRYAQ